MIAGSRGTSGKAQILRSQRRSAVFRRRRGRADGGFRLSARFVMAAGRFFSADASSLPIESRINRLRAIGAVLTCFALLSVWRLYFLQRADHSRWTEIATKQHYSRIEIQGARGAVMDKTGRPLAVSVPAVAVGVHPRRVGDIRDAARRLAQVLGEDEAELLGKLSSNKKFIWAARGVPEKKREEVSALGLRGLEIFDEFRRVYPQGTVAGPLIGAIGTDGAGLSGIEQEFNPTLAAQPYDLDVHRDARGRYVTAAAWAEQDDLEGRFLRGFRLSMNPFGWLSRQEQARPLRTALRLEGKPVVLSIDSVIQAIVEAEFEKGRLEAKAKKVFGLVLDADTGEILAMAQTPGTNPGDRQKQGPESLRNFVIQDGFEPGSTLKPLVAAAALDQKTVGGTEIFDCENGRYRVGGFTVKDVHPIGVVNFRDVLIRSSNIGMAKIGQRMGRKRLHQALDNYGFGKRSGVELSGESTGILRPISTWADIDVATHSFGQGISVTAVQLVQAYAALANGGMLIQPTLLKQNEKAAAGQRVLNQKTAQQISDILREVTEDEHGTGTNARIAGLSVHGKTGTAQKARENGRGYASDKIIASFIGFVDGTQIGISQRLVMIAVVDEPGVQPRWGGVVAAPLFRRSMERTLSHLVTQNGSQVQTAEIAARRYSRS